MKKLVVMLAFALLTTACGSLELTDQAPKTTPPAPKIQPFSFTPDALPSDFKIMIRTSSMSLIVDDPVEALSTLEQAVQDAGGTVMSASSYTYPESGSYSNLNARVPPEALADLRRTAHSLATQVQNDSIYNQDVTGQYKDLHERLVRLHQADAHLWELITSARDPKLVESLTLLRELLQQDMTNVESQLHGYDDGATLASLDITLSGSVEPQIILE